MNRLLRLRYRVMRQPLHLIGWSGCSYRSVAHQRTTSRCIQSLHTPLLNSNTSTIKLNSCTIFRYQGSIPVDAGAKKAHHPRTREGRVDIANLTRQLLSDSTKNNSSRESYKVSLEKARTDASFIKSLGLTASDAQSMYLLPPTLLSDVHSAISHFSKRENSQGIVLDDQVVDGNTKYKKTPGPIICARLLELIGIPHHYSDLAAKLGSAPLLIVHSSQVDLILHCCLQTTLALSNSCKIGKGSLLGYDFNFNDDWQGGDKKTAAHLCEEIWRHVWNTEIKFTFERTGQNAVPPPAIGMRYNHLLASAIDSNPILDCLNDSKSMPPSSPEPWRKKDQRRYKQAVSLFNSTLASFARTGSSATGIRQEVRKDMVQSAERMLLELAAKNTKVKPSQSTVLQCTQPDVISFNTAMNAWLQLSPRNRSGEQDENSASMATLTAERTQAILEMMQELWDEERSTSSTKQAMQDAWDAYNDGEYQPRAVFPNTSSYNTVLSAWSRSSGNHSIDRAIEVFEMMVDRYNQSCNERVSLMGQNMRSQLGHVENASSGYHACPDSRTFVALLSCCSNMRSKSFSDSVDQIENIHDTMKYWDEQLQWSNRHGISPDALSSTRDQPNPIINVFTYNALVNAYASIPKLSWEESLQCCNRIEEITTQMREKGTPPDAVTRGIAIDAWIKCADFASNDQAKKELCVEKACVHLNSMMTSQRSAGDKYENAGSIASRVVHSLNDVIALCGKSSMPSKANELFLLGKECNLISNLRIYATTIDALTQSRDISDIETALHHVFELEKDMLKKRSNVPHNKHDFTWMHNAIISGFINSKQSEDGCNKAHKLLLHMIDSHSLNQKYIGQANATSFALAMDALAKRGRSKEVQDLLVKLEQLHQRRRIDACDKDSAIIVEPNINHYNILMTSYLRGNAESDFELAQKLFNRMKNDTRIPSPDAITESLLLRIQARDQIEPIREECTAEPPTNDCNTKLDDLIRDTIRQSQSSTPTSFNTIKAFESFNAIMKTLVHAGTVEGAEKATALLRRMEEMHAAGDIEIGPDIVLYNLAMNAWQQCEKSSDVTSSVCPSAKAEEILQLLCNQYKAGNRDVAPNDASFSICIHSWCSNSEPNATERAEGILRLKEEFLNQVDGLTIRTTDYNSILSRCKDDPDGGQKQAIALFEAMLMKSSEAEAYQPPNEFSFNTVLSVHAKSNDDRGAEKAEAFLRQLNKLYDEKKTSVQPSMISYRTVINAYISRKHSDAPQKVESLVDELFEKSAQGRDDLKPDSIVLDLILKACNLVQRTWFADAKEKADTQIIEIANRTFTKIRANSQQTHSTYAFMFRIFNRHMNFNDPRYELLMKNLWKGACRDGLVSEFTLESLRQSVKESTFFDCIGRPRGFNKAGSVKVGSLDHDWRRNVTAKRQNTPG